MRAVVQLCDSASVTVDDKKIAEIDNGLAVLLGVGFEDSEQDAKYLAEKISNLRIFPDEKGKMNFSLLDIHGKLLVVSQFTLFGDCRKGRRPSFDSAAAPENAYQLYLKFVEYCTEYGLEVCCGQFQAEMIVSLSNHGPVTIMIDSKKTF